MDTDEKVGPQGGNCYTVMLELALWKCSLSVSNLGSGNRVAARVSCGAEVIINEVMQFLSSGDFEADI